MRDADAHPGATDIKIDDGSATVWFSPNTPHARQSHPAAGETTPPDMQQVFDLMDAAKEAILFLVFQPGSPSIVEKAAAAANDRTGCWCSRLERRPYVRLIVLRNGLRHAMGSDLGYRNCPRSLTYVKMSLPLTRSSPCKGLDKAIDDLETEISSAHAQNEVLRLLDKVPGIGKLIASVIATSVLDPSVFKSGRDFAAWLGLTPRQNSSGGKQTLGGITKQGHRFTRKLLVLGATSLLSVVGKRKEYQAAIVEVPQ